MKQINRGVETWGVLLIVLMAIYYLFVDENLRPAVVVDHDFTHTEDINGFKRNQFKLGEEVVIVGRGEVKRSCPKTFIRTLKDPDGQYVELQSGHGMRFVPGPGAGRIVIDPKFIPRIGEWEFSSLGYHYCLPVNPQVIEGWKVKFTIH